MNQKLKRYAAALAVFLLLMWICTVVSRSFYVKNMTRVTVATPEQKYITHTVEAQGQVEAGAERAVTVLAGLRVDRVCVKTGDTVEAGDTLFTIDVADLEDIIAQKERALAEQSAQYEAAVANTALAETQRTRGITWAQENYETAQTENEVNVRRAQEAVARAEERLDEYEQTSPDVSGGDSAALAWQETKQTLEDELRAAQEALEDAQREAENALREKQRDITSASDAVGADATTKIYQTEIAGLQAELGDYYALRDAGGEVTASDAGSVLEVDVTPGSRTQDAAALLLSDGDSNLFIFTIDDEQSKYMRLGDTVEIELAGNTLDAEIAYQNRNAAGGYTMSCVLPEGSGQVGLAGTARRTEQGELQSLCVPMDALTQENEAYYIWLVQEDEGILGTEYTVTRIRVDVLDQNGTTAAISSSAITADSQIVTYASQELTQGESVRVE